MGVSVGPHRFGGVEFVLGMAEIGHIHRNGILDIPFPTAIRHQLTLQGIASEHHVLPKSGRIGFRVSSDAGLRHAICLLKLSYLRHLLKGKASSLVSGHRPPTSGLDGLRALNMSGELTAFFERAITPQGK